MISLSKLNFMKKFLILILISVYLHVFAEGMLCAEVSEDNARISDIRKLFSQGLYDSVIEQAKSFISMPSQKVFLDEARMLIGKSFYQNADYEKSLLSFEKIISSDISDFKAEALYWSGEANFKLGRYDNAVSFYKKLIDSYPLSYYIPYAHYSKGWCYYQKGEIEASLEDFDKVIRDYPDSGIAPSSAYKLAEAYYALSRFDEAKRSIDFYIEKFPLAVEAKDALYLKGEILYHMGDYSGAAASYQYSLKLAGERAWEPYAYLGTAWAFFNAKDYGKAEVEFSNLMDRGCADECRENAMFGLARCYAAQGRYKEAVSAYGCLLKDYDKSKYYEDYYFNRAEMLCMAGDDEKVVQAYMQFLDIFPKARLLSQAYYNLARAYLKLENFSNALLNFEKAFTESADMELKADSLCRMADIYSETGDYKTAQKYYDEVLRGYPDSAHAGYAQYNLGVVFIALNEPASAVITLKSFLSNFPESPLTGNACLQMANALYSQGHYEAALEEYNKIIESCDDIVLVDKARYQAGACFCRMGDYSKAVEIFNQLIVSETEQGVKSLSQYELGWCYFKMGKEDLAIKTFDDYITRYPEGSMAADVIYWFAQYYYNKGSYARARISLKRILEGFPESGLDDESYYLLAWTLYREGNTREALKQLERVILQYPDSPTAEKSIISIADIFIELDRFNDAVNVLNGIEKQAQNQNLRNTANKKIGLLYQSKGFYNLAISYYKKAITSESNDFNAELQFRIAECLEDEDSTDEAVAGYLGIVYMYPKSLYWGIRARLRAAHIYESQAKWPEARKIYEDIALENTEESKYAKERLMWMNKHRDEL